MATSTHGHVDTWNAAFETVETGASAITHVPQGPIPQTMIAAMRRHRAFALGALRSATTTAGEFLGVRVGVNPGDLASLVLLSASPIENIENTEKIVAMIHRGKIVDREALLKE